ncbi:hypothetical protein DFH08DRAFT_812799 [Mycena albidolilacea]|uniref:Uncharacterized protein n=1 Tax=Mycena albidolilacea TaxID=1033008 RepID=A0AAD6ZU63_9AGAR|nr:hypothetical protein DFH08DRAFT_812799 [Mycena albidolilacea]
MRFTLSVPVFVLAAAAAASADKCAVCKDTLLPGVAEIVWTLVFNRTVADNEIVAMVYAAYMSKRYRGRGRNNSTAQTFCTYTANTGTIIPNDQSLQACPKKVTVVNCH